MSSHSSNKEFISHAIETEEEDESIHTIVKESNDVHDVLHEIENESESESESESECAAVSTEFLFSSNRFHSSSEFAANDSFDNNDRFKNISSLSQSSSKVLKMRFDCCHTFHTNPALFKKCVPSTDISYTDKKSKADNTAASLSAKSLKRKQRLAHSKGLHTSKVTNTDSVTSKTTINDVHNINNSSHGTLAQYLTGSACHTLWSPSPHHVRNHVELLAISSPFHSVSSHQTHTHNQPNNNNGVPQSQNSLVYILVFEEGAFRKQGNESLCRELGDIMGLPNLSNQIDNEDVAGWKRDSFVFQGSKKSEELEMSESDLNNNSHSPSLSPVASRKTKKKSTNNRISVDVTESSTTTCGISGGIAAREPKLFFQMVGSHLYEEVLNVGKVFLHEIVGDGRLLKRDNTNKDYLSIASALNQLLNIVGIKTNKKTESVDSAENIKSHPNQAKKQRQESQRQKLLYNKALQVKPSLVFQIDLPYTNNHNQQNFLFKNAHQNSPHHYNNHTSTPMEVVNLEWNEDGTTLSILQRRKGAAGVLSTSASTIPSSLATSNARTNKKKNQGGNANALPHSSYHPSISGNTAVSFWSVPDWLLVDCDDDYDLDEEEECIRDDIEENLLRSNQLINSVCTGEEVGCELVEGEGNKTYFPMWEWYLTNYLLRDDLLINPSINSHHVVSNKSNNTELTSCSNYSVRTGPLVSLQGFPIDLIKPSLALSASSVSLHRKKSGRAGGRNNVIGDSNNSSVMMNGDVTCLFWEEHTSLFLDQLEEQYFENENIDKMNDNEAFENSFDDQTIFLPKSNATNSFAKEAAEVMNAASISKTNKKNVHKDKPKKEIKQFSHSFSKWIAMGTSKGHVVLHNSAASHLSHQARKSQSNVASTVSAVGGLATAMIALCSVHARTITIPRKHKRRITCIAWVDNLLVFGSVGSGQLTIVSTSWKEGTIPSVSAGKEISTSSHTGAVKVGNETFQEKNVKVIGNILLPGGRDAVHVAISTVEDEHGGVKSILSVNCEAKFLLFYTFPNLFREVHDEASISTKAIEISFSMDKGSKGLDESSFISTSSEPLIDIGVKGASAICGNIIRHFLIPNSYLVLVAFSAGYFALVDWSTGTIICDAEVISKKCNNTTKSRLSNSTTSSGKEEDPFLLDVAFHPPTGTFAALTHGHVVAFQVRILNGIHEAKGGDCVCETGLVINTKTHTKPKTKSSKINLPPSTTKKDNINFRRDLLAMFGTIDKLASIKLANVPILPTDGRKGRLLDFSADGECISISLGDESVSILRLRIDDFHEDRERSILTESIFIAKDRLYISLFMLLCLLLVMYFDSTMP